MAARVILAGFTGTLVGIACVAAHAQGTLPVAYESAARAAGVPPRILFAVAQQESGIALRGQVIPWPWTLNAAGAPSRFFNRIEACAALRRALRRTRSIDVGLGQVNMRYHGHRVRDPCELLDPYRNLAITATILREQHAPGEDWLLAAGRYHRPAGGSHVARYRLGVAQHMARLLAQRDARSPMGARP